MSAQESLQQHEELQRQIQSLELNTEYRLDLNPESIEFIGALGEGSGGAVSKVRHKRSGIILARKVIHIQAEQSKTIVRELQLLHDCNSPYIVSFYGGSALVYVRVRVY